MFTKNFVGFVVFTALNTWVVLSFLGVGICVTSWLRVVV